MADDDGLSKWSSMAYDFYKDIVGEEEFASQMEKVNKDPPPPGLLSALQLYRQKKKLKFLFGLGALKLGTRPTHPRGIGAYGSAMIVSNPQLPKCQFFTAGKTFPVRLRHSNFDKGHDAAADLRAAAIKFADAEDGGPLDVIMMTGPGTVLFDIQAVFDASSSLRAGTPEAYKEYLMKSPEYFRNYVEGARRAPDSYHDLRYYSKIIHDFKADDGVQRYARFRMLPDDEHPETGFLSEKECRQPWLKEQYPSETRSSNYLKEEFKGRLSQGTVKYRLQIQLHIVRPDDPPKLLYIGRGWDEATHPWLDVAVITLTSLLPSDVTERMRFAVNNSPQCLALLPARSVHDSNSISQVRSEVYPWTQKLRLLRSLPSNNDEQSQYLVRVETGTQYGADSDATISITLFGTKGRTDSMVLNKWFHDDHERGKTDEYSLRCMNVGEVLLLQLHNDQGGELFKSSEWFVEDISVLSADEDATFEFPCHQWIMGDTKVFQGKALLPQQKQDELVRLERRAQVHERQALYKWGKRSLFDGLPGFIDASKPSDLPRDSQSPGNAAGESESSGIFTELFSRFESWNDFNAFRKILENVSGNIPKCAEGDKWMEDRICGMQFLNGCNPGIIRRCNTLPGHFPVTDVDVSAQLSRGLKLQQEIEAGHIYIVDYKDLEGVDRSCAEGQQMFAAEPLGLFYVKPTGDLVPIAIQLHQQPGDTNPIWTPNDSRYDWLLAKMWLRHADYQVHQVLGRLLNVQLPMEAVAVATWRQLASVHPVYKLLLPHIHPILAVNTSARNQLEERGVVNGMSFSLSLDGQIQLLRKSYKSFRFSMLSLPQNLKERGVDDPTKLPNFHYRDDALLLWEVISNFVDEVLSVYYKSDDDVKGDNELKAWVQDIHQNGFPERPGDVDHEFPASLSTLEQLVHLITCVLFNCSCQNAAVTGNTFEVCAFIPNTPPLMRQSPPTQKGTATLKGIMETLPDKSQAKQYVSAISQLSSAPRNQDILGAYCRFLFVDDEAEEAISRFHAKLHEASQAISDRNRKREWPYHLLVPESVSNTIH